MRSIKAISSTDRLPTLWTSYFIIIDGRKDICRLDWIIRFHAKYPEIIFYWIEMEPQPPKKELKVEAKAEKKPYEFFKPFMK